MYAESLDNSVRTDFYREVTPHADTSSGAPPTQFLVQFQVSWSCIGSPNIEPNSCAMCRGQRFTALLHVLCSLRAGAVDTNGISPLNTKQSPVPFKTPAFKCLTAAFNYSSTEFDVLLWPPGELAYTHRHIQKWNVFFQTQVGAYRGKWQPWLTPVHIHELTHTHKVEDCSNYKYHVNSCLHRSEIWRNWGWINMNP